MLPDITAGSNSKLSRDSEQGSLELPLQNTAESRVTRNATCISIIVDGTRYLARPTNSSVSSTLSMAGMDEPWQIWTNTSASGEGVTVLNVRKRQVLDGPTLNLLRRTCLDIDSVFCTAFLRRIIFVGVNPEAVTSSAKRLLAQWGNEEREFRDDLDVPSGPYFESSGILHSAWRIYDDVQLAFVLSTWPTPSSSRYFVTVPAAASPSRALGIAVPARYYNSDLGPGDDIVTTVASPSRTRSMLLRSLRVVIKDNFKLCGAPSRHENSEVVTRLLQAGANVVGKAHMSAFAMMEHPTQSVEFTAPFNPRGDGYLITGGSSGGSAAAIASYEWLDVAICSDTTGSARIPALKTGIFGFRPSTFSISSAGLEKAWAAVDTPAWFARDLDLFPRVLMALADEARMPSRRPPKRVLYIEDFEPANNEEQRQMTRAFIEDLAVDGIERKTISIADDWSENAPVEEKDLTQYFYHLMDHGLYYSAYHSFSTFRKEYLAKHGHTPFVTEVIRWYWHLGMKVTDAQHTEIMHRVDVFKKWFDDFYFSGSNADTVFVLDIDNAQPVYRDQYPGAQSPLKPGLGSTYLAALLQAPELAVPIGDIPYASRITDQEERLPVVASLMGAPGSDADLIDWTLQALKKSGRPTTVQVGKRMFNDADLNQRLREDNRSA